MQEYITQSSLIIILFLTIVFYLALNYLHSKYLDAVEEINIISIGINNLSTEAEELHKTCDKLDSRCTEYVEKLKDLKSENSKTTGYTKRTISLSDNKFMAGMLENSEDVKKIFQRAKEEEEDSMMYC